VKFPMVGLGTFLCGNADTMKQILQTALDVGYRHIDTAIAYENHKMIGEALKSIFSEGKYKRSDVFITSKIFPDKS